MKIAVYTFISNNYDTLIKYNPEFKKEADFFIFTDNKDIQLIKDGYFKALNIKFKGINPRNTARYYKINSHFTFDNYDYVIYQDGTTMMNTIGPVGLIEKYLSDADIAAFRYPDEDCTYIHAEKCKNVGRINAIAIDRHMNYYRNEYFPEHYGFSEMRVVLRKNTQQIKMLNELWWNIYNSFLTCDQLCFDYALWKLGIKRNHIPFFYPWDEGEHEFITSQQHNYFNPHKYYDL
jgi:hypothetical protein